MRNAWRVRSRCRVAPLRLRWHLALRRIRCRFANSLRRSGRPSAEIRDTRPSHNNQYNHRNPQPYPRWSGRLVLRGFRCAFVPERRGFVFDRLDSNRRGRFVGRVWRGRFAQLRWRHRRHWHRDRPATCPLQLSDQRGPVRRPIVPILLQAAHHCRFEFRDRFLRTAQSLVANAEEEAIEPFTGFGAYASSARLDEVLILAELKIHRGFD